MGANWKAAERHNVFARAERVENNELFDHHSPLHDVPLTVSKLSLGYAWQLPLGGEWNLALGGLVSAYDKPERIDFAYGDDPRSFMLFRSEEHTSELQSLMRISYAVFCLKKKKQQIKQ